MKCVISHCGWDKPWNIICGAHLDQWGKSPEKRRDNYTALGDWIRRVEAEHRNGGGK